MAALTAAGLVASASAPARATHDGFGYWMLTADGHVHGFGGAAPLGDTVSATTARVDIRSTRSC